MGSESSMTAPDSRYLDEAMARLTEAVAQPVGGSIVISTADACAIGNELRRLQALARGPQQAGGEDGFALDAALDRAAIAEAEVARMKAGYVELETMYQQQGLNAFALLKRAETAEAALRLAHSHLDMPALRVSHCKDAAAIDAALNGGQDDG